MNISEIPFSSIQQIRIGHWEDVKGGTGCTICLAEKGAACGVDVRGGGPASRETELLKPTAAVEKIHAVLLCGGSAFGLAAADGVMSYLKDRQIGFDTPYGPVPLVVASSIYDLPCGDKDAYPQRDSGYAAAVNAVEKNEALSGNYGAGTGATIGKIGGPRTAMKSGQGFCAYKVGDLSVGACIVVNALGDVVDKNGSILAGMRREDGSFADSQRILVTQGFLPWTSEPGTVNTTIGFVVTNGKFNKTQMNKAAAICSNGLVRSIRPVNTTADGDSLYALATGEVEADLNQMGALGAMAVEEAVRRAVKAATGLHGFPALQNI